MSREKSIVENLAVTRSVSVARYSLKVIMRNILAFYAVCVEAMEKKTHIF